MQLAQLSVFIGGWSAESAAHIQLVDHELAADGLLEELIDHSLIQVTNGGSVRYTMLELVRSYAAERLAERGEADQLRSRHASYFLGLAERAAHELEGHNQLPMAGTTGC